MICRDLILQVEPEQADAFIDELTRHLPQGWRRRADHDERVATPSLRGFVYERYAGSHSEMLVLYQRESTFEVGNIVSSAGNLEPAEYNAIVEAFAEVVTGILGSRVTATLGPDNEGTLAERLGAAPMRLLEEYEGCANKHTGGAHPLDRGRWNRFVIACHRAGVGEPDDVRAFLTERGWAERHVEAHADRLEYGRDLLASYDEA